MARYPEHTAPDVHLDFDWLAKFEAEHGRKPRMLLLGNVANYAYVTAKLLRNRGVEAVVVDPDFYHIMASPEWHEVDDAGAYGDDYFPKWTTPRRLGYRRPNWFIQGPWEQAFNYLHAQEFGTPFESRKAKLVNDMSRRVTSKDLPQSIYWAIKTDFAFVRKARRALGILTRLGRGRQVVETTVLPVAADVVTAYEAAQPPVAETAIEVTKPISTPNPIVAAPPVMPEPDAVPAENFTPEISGAEALQDAAAPVLPQAELASIAPNAQPAAIPPGAQYVNDRKAYFQKLFGQFDIVLGYTTLSYFPLAAEFDNFASIELGTIRGLPFEDSDLGRLTRWVYENSPEVLVTNTDCIGAAKRMGLSAEKVHPVLHPFSLDDIVDEDPQAYLSNISDVPFFFAPARHQWFKGNDSELKGNDVYIRAAATLRKKGYDFRLILVDWGLETDRSKELVSELELGDITQWIKPQPRRALWAYYRQSAAVIDQFHCDAFGGISLEAMALGKRVITRFDWSTAQAFFRTRPPLMESNHAADVEANMEACLNNLGDDEKLGKTAQSWIKTEHSEARQLELIVAAIAPLLFRDNT